MESDPVLLCPSCCLFCAALGPLGTDPSSLAVLRRAVSCRLHSLPPIPNERRSPYPEIRFDLRRRSVGPVALRTEGERDRRRPTGASSVYVHLTDFAYLTKCY